MDRKTTLRAGIVLGLAGEMLFNTGCAPTSVEANRLASQEAVLVAEMKRDGLITQDTVNNTSVLQRTGDFRERRLNEAHADRQAAILNEIEEHPYRSTLLLAEIMLGGTASAAALFGAGVLVTRRLRS